MNTHVCLSPNGVDIYRLDAPPRALLVSTMDGVIELRGNLADNRWEVVNHTLDGLHVSSLMKEPTRGGIFAGVHGEGLYRSLDGGNSWETSMRGLAVPHVFSVACNARDGTLYAGTEPAHVFCSRDGGDTWEDLAALRAVEGQDKWWFPAPPHLPHVKNISIDPRDGRTLYVSVEQGALLKSVAGGQTFEQLFFEDAGCRYNNDAHRVV
ncbi:MAG: glycosyl hydrolase, partial [Steroidobacteraceae bacterium]